MLFVGKVRIDKSIGPGEPGKKVGDGEFPKAAELPSIHPASSKRGLSSRGSGTVPYPALNRRVKVVPNLLAQWAPRRSSFVLSQSRNPCQ